jgi:hypothetical protein
MTAKEGYQNGRQVKNIQNNLDVFVLENDCIDILKKELVDDGG